MTNAPGPKAYPITASTFVLMYKTPKNAENSVAARKFFRWALEKGQKQAIALDYVPLPSPLVKKVEGYVTANIK
jgi:phosphate transport system substrate-binding protein